MGESCCCGYGEAMCIACLAGDHASCRTSRQNVIPPEERRIRLLEDCIQELARRLDKAGL